MEEVEHRLAPDESFQEGFANTFVPTRDFVSIVMILAGCRFYVTTKGRICPVRIDVKEGDEIAIISGAPTPFVLRRACVVNTYTLESDAYVRGLMSGEAVREGSFNPSKINLVYDCVALEVQNRSTYFDNFFRPLF